MGKILRMRNVKTLETAERTLLDLQAKCASYQQCLDEIQRFISEHGLDAALEAHFEAWMESARHPPVLVAKAMALETGEQG